MKIACIGNIVFDCTVRCKNFLREGAKHSFDNAVFVTGGPASTAASVLTRFGNQVDFYGQIGKDGFGAAVYQEMLDENINLTHVSRSKENMTPFGFIIVTGINRTICSLRSPKDFIKPEIDNVQYEDGYDFILTDGKYKDETLQLMNKNRNAISIIDAGRANDDVIELCRHVNYIVCSEEFANAVSKHTINKDSKNNEMVFRTLQEKFPNAMGITITIGDRGYICEQDGEVVNFPAYQSGMPAIDTNGAGDIFHGAFTHALANGYDYYDSLKFANITASLSTTKRGGRKSCPTLQDVEDIMHPKVFTK